ncbi:MAG: 2OG-Fe(II) oxygenase [bacterium]
MKDIINQKTIKNQIEIGNQFSDNKPFKHVVIEEFFTPEFCEHLLQEFPSFDEKLAMNENGEVGRKAVHEKVQNISPSYKKLDELVKSEEFIKMVEKMTGIDGLIYDPYYFGGGTHNNLHGQDLDPHVDFTHHPMTGHHRRMNLIVYLNKEWQKEWGGNIELHKNPRLEPEQDDIVSVEPLFNRAVIFETNNISWHGFPRINLPEDKQSLSRKSFALYYYTDSRKEPVKPHSTIYVERHLSGHIKSGTTLSDEEFQEIKILLDRRDQHLERLYNNITHLMEENEGLQWQKDELKAQLKELHEMHDDSENESDVSEQKLQIKNQLLRKRIDELEQSTSWRITSPLRRIVSLFR